MIKIKVKDTPKIIKNNIKCRKYNTLEGIVLLDITLDLLKNEMELSDNDIWEMLKDYRANLKEKESD